MAQHEYGEPELALLREVLQSGRLCSLNGAMTGRFEAAFAGLLGASQGIAMSSAMCVLHAAVITAGAGPGTEVICDPVCVFGPLAVLYEGAVPVFADIEPTSMQMDPAALEAAITERTRAVIVTHVWGLPAQMDRIVEIAHRHHLLVIEDCAHAILATYHGRCAGTWGDVGSFSFQGSKQMSLGDGGMAVTSDPDVAKALDLHAGAPTFLAVAHGLHYNYRMNELTAAVGLAQVGRIAGVVAGLRANARHLDQAVEGCRWLTLQAAPEAESSYHFWAAGFRGEEHGLALAEFRQALEAAQAGLGLGYTGLPADRHPVFTERAAHAFHCPENGGRAVYPDGLCPVAEHAIPRMLTWYTLQPEEQAKQAAERLHRLIGELEGR